MGMKATGETRPVPAEANSGVWSPLRVVVRAVTRRLAVKANVKYGADLRVGRGAIVYGPHSLSIGNHVSIGPHTIIQVDGHIGDFVLIGMGVQIVGRRDHAVDEVGTPIAHSTWIGERDATDKDKIVIERDAWIGGASVVMSGIRIGEGAIVAAGSVVTRDLLPYTINGGNPAQLIRRRFATAEDEQIHSRALDQLLKC